MRTYLILLLWMLAIGVCYSQKDPFKQTPFDSAVVKYGYLVKIYVKPQEKGYAYPTDYFYFDDIPNVTKETSAKDLLKMGTLIYVHYFHMKQGDIYIDFSVKRNLFSDFESNPISAKKVANSSMIKIFPVALVYSKTKTMNITIKKYTEKTRQPSRVSHFHGKKDLFDKKTKLIKPELIAPLTR